MGQEVTLRLPVPYRERISTPTGRTVERTAFAETEMTVRAFSGWRAGCIAFARLRATDDVYWLRAEDDTRQMRPLLRETSEPAGRGLGYRKASRFWWDEEEAGRDVGTWPDYPFPGWVANDEETSSERGTVIASDRDARVRQARAIASGLLVCNGHIYKRAPVATWVVEDLREVLPGMARLSVILPDLEHPVVGGRQPRARLALGLFAPDEQESALRLSRELFGLEAPRLPRRKPMDDIHVMASEFASMYAQRDPLPVEAIGTLRLCRRLFGTVAGRDAWEIGGERFEGAFERFGQAFAQVEAAIQRRKATPLAEALAVLAETTGHAADVLSREVGADDEILFLFRAATLLRTCRPARPRIVQTETVEEYAFAPGM